MITLSAIASFNIIESTTVAANYRWDDGTPISTISKYDLITNDPNLILTSTNESGVVYTGRSPFTYITLSSTYTPHPSAVAVKRVYDFGDYYNSETNTIVSTCFEKENVCHVYIMPGIYTIKMTVTEYRLKSDVVPIQAFNQQSATTTAVPDIFWQWKNFLCNGQQNPLNKLLKWNSGECQNIQWKDTAPCLDQPICTWNSTCRLPETQCTDPGPQKPLVSWDNINCNDKTKTADKQTCLTCNEPIPQIEVVTTVYTKDQIVSVSEISPMAFIDIISIDSNKFPCTIKLSPKNIQSGSFPIERIDWNFGDGTPTQTIRRNTKTPDLNFTYNGVYEPDYKDPRNYDATHTYYKNDTKISGTTFYPSLTCYTSSTAQIDCVKAVIGPIYNFSDQEITQEDDANTSVSSTVSLLQNELNDNGRLLMAEIDRTLVVWRYDK